MTVVTVRKNVLVEGNKRRNLRSRLKKVESVALKWSSATKRIRFSSQSYRFFLTNVPLLKTDSSQIVPLCLTNSSVDMSEERDDGGVPVAESVDADDEHVHELEESYQESRRFQTWRKHVRDLYQTSVHIDTLWESTTVQFLPFMTCKDHCATQTVLCGTRTMCTSQNYLQLANITLPCDSTQISKSAFDITTGEIGGFGSAPAQCSFRMERRMAHSGDVLQARYMPVNPLVLGSCSSDGNVYIFDWSRISKLTPPNAPERPYNILPPNNISDDSSPQEKAQYHRTIRAMRTITSEQDKWDKRTYPPQHVLSLSGSSGKPVTMDFETSTEGKLIAGSDDKVCMWHIGNLPKDVIPKPQKNGMPTPQVSLQPTWEFTHPNEAKVQIINDVKFKWCDANNFLAATAVGTVLQGDLRQAGMTELCAVVGAKRAPIGVQCTAMPFEESHSLLVGTIDGNLREYDTRRPGQLVSNPVHCHVGDVSVIQFCPHSKDLVATAGDDGFCSIYNIRRQSSQLLFKHSAHVERVTDLNWNWQDVYAGMLVTADPTSMTVWRPREFFFNS